MPVLTSPPISDSTNRLIDRAVEDFDAELKPYVEIIRSGQPFQARQLAIELHLSLDVVLLSMARAVQTFGGVIRSLEIDEAERQPILRWLSRPRSQGEFLTSSEFFARIDKMLSEMDAA